MPDPFVVNIDPVALALGPVKVHWYGIMYLLAFGAYWLLGSYRARQPDSGWTKDDVGDLLFYGALGVILGGRLGYMLFYDLDNVLAEPSRIFRIWEGGMSFHGGLIGVIAAMAWYGRKTQRTFFQVADFVAPLVPVGLGFGRIGNFIGGELWGRCSEVSWAMVFPRAPIPGSGDWQEAVCQAAQQARHPSQLYQALLEGVALFALVWVYSRKPRPTMAVSGLFLMGYGVFRFAVEFFRQPDSHLGFIAFDWLTMGQLLSTPLILLGAVMMGLAYRKAG